MNIKLEQKKEYTSPEMELVEMKASTKLLEDSCPPDECIEFPIGN